MFCCALSAPLLDDVYHRVWCLPAARTNRIVWVALIVRLRGRSVLCPFLVRSYDTSLLAIEQQLYIVFFVFCLDICISTLLISIFIILPVAFVVRLGFYQVYLQLPLVRGAVDSRLVAYQTAMASHIVCTQTVFIYSIDVNNAQQ